MSKLGLISQQEAATMQTLVEKVNALEDSLQNMDSLTADAPESFLDAILYFLMKWVNQKHQPHLATLNRPERESERTSSCATEKNCNNHTDLLLLILEHENVPYCRSQRLPSKWRRMLEQPLRNSLCWRECVWCHVIPYLRLSSLTVTPSTRRFLYKNDTTCALRFNYWLKF